MPQKAKPVVTYAFIAVCVLATVSFYKQLISFALTSGGHPDFGAFFHRTGIGFIPKFGLETPSAWVTSIFYHSGFSHLFWNMVALWFFGRSAERSLSRSEYLELFFTSGLIGTLFTFLFTPTSDVPHLGASGAIMGLMSFYFLGSAERRGGGFWNTLKAYWLCLVAMALFIFPDMILAAAQTKGHHVGNVGYLAHSGGALGGWLFHYLMGGAPEAARAPAYDARPIPAPVRRRAR